MIDYAAALLQQNRLFGDTIRGADLATPVPTCPGWSLLQLFRHLGRGHRWAAQMIRERRTESLDFRAVADGKPPADEPGALDWLHESAQLVLDAVEQTGADVEVWTFLGPRPAAWWIRRRLHEETVHRADAAIALGVDHRLSPELGADGLSEHLDRLATENARALDEGTSLHLHATDTDAEWTVQATPTGITWDASHTKASTALRGPAAELLLVTTRRHTPAEGGVEVLGDPAVWAAWLDRTPF